jgi:phosphatidylglycerol:prolipoprotein diacylglycerol transferase
MIEELFHIGSFSISPFGVTLVVALFAAYLQMRKGMQHYGIGSEEDASGVVFAAGFFGILGGKVYYAILTWDWHTLFDRAGIVFYGCFIGGLLAALWQIRRRQLPMARTFDAIGPALALGYGVGRVGCFLVGDDYGVPTSLPWGVTFKVGLPPTTAGNLRHYFGVDVPPEIADSAWVAVHPTQLYETGLALLIWGFALFLMTRRELRPGVLGLTIIGLLAVERFAVEFIRAKDDRIFDGSLTVAQLISLAILASVILIGWRRARSAPSARGA